MEPKQDKGYQPRKMTKLASETEALSMHNPNLLNILNQDTDLAIVAEAESFRESPGMKV